jgi:hypothetical protein
MLLFAFSGRMYTTDVLGQYEVATSLVGARPLMTVSGEFGWTVAGIGSQLYLPHGVGFSILLIPAALVGILSSIAEAKVMISLINALFSMLLVGFWYSVASRKYPGHVPAARFIMVAIGGMVLAYGKMTFDVTAAAAALMAAYYYSESDRNIVAGLLIGIALLLRLDSVLFLPLFLGSWRKMRDLLIGMVPFVILILAANWLRFGNPLADGHGQDPAISLEPFRGGIPGLLLSPGKGLLYYAPLCILALFYQKDWKLWTPFVLSLLFHGALHDWTGGTGWGPRFLFTALPFLLLPLCRKGAGGKLFWPLAILGAMITLAAVWSNTSAIEQASGADLFDTPSRQAVIWTYSASPLVRTLSAFGSGPPDVLGATAAPSAGISPWLGAAAQWFAALIIGVAGIRLIRKRCKGEAEKK